MLPALLFRKSDKLEPPSKVKGREVNVGGAVPATSLIPPFPPLPARGSLERDPVSYEPFVPRHHFFSSDGGLYGSKSEAVLGFSS